MSKAVPSGREMADIAVKAGAIDMAQGVVHTTPPDIFFDLLSEHFGERQMHVYASPAGLASWRDEILKSLMAEGGDVKKDMIMATAGVTGGLIAALRVNCKPFDKVLLLEPFYPAHDWAIQAMHLVTEYLPYGDDWSLDMEAIEKKLPDVSAFVLANPGNPTGTVATAEELEKLHRLCTEHDVLLLVDEVYKDFIWEGAYSSLLAKAENFNQLVILRSWSKNLALAGWRVGYAVTSEERRANMTQVHDAFSVGAPAAPQYVMAEMLRDHQGEIDKFVSSLVNRYGENRATIAAAFDSIGMNPEPKQGAYYMMVKHNRASDMDTMKELLDLGIAVAPGTPFWRPGTKDTGYIRIHFALGEGVAEKVVKALK